MTCKTPDFGATINFTLLFNYLLVVSE